MSAGLDVLRARVAFRQRSFMDVMDLALRFLVVNIRLYAKVAAFVLLPCIGLTLVAVPALGWLGAWLVALALSFLAQVPFTVLASRLVFQERVSALTVLRSGARELPRVLVMRTAWMIMATVGTIAMMAPGAWVAAIFLYVDEVMILERARIIPAFGRSQRITSGSMGDAFCAVLMMVSLPLLAILLADVGGRAFIGDLLQFRPPAPVWTEGGSVLAVLGWFGVVPYVTTARFFTYLNTRTRAEGWDIQTRFAAIAARAEQQDLLDPETRAA